MGKQVVICCLLSIVDDIRVVNCVQIKIRNLQQYEKKTIDCTILMIIFLCWCIIYYIECLVVAQL